MTYNADPAFAHTGPIVTNAAPNTLNVNTVVIPAVVGFGLRVMHISCASKATNTGKITLFFHGSGGGINFAVAGLVPGSSASILLPAIGISLIPFSVQMLVDDLSDVAAQTYYVSALYASFDTDFSL